MTDLFLELVKMNLIGTLFAAVVMAVRLIFSKAPKWIFVALWGVVALRLILPFSLESKLSVVPDSLASGEVIANVSDTYIGPVDIIYEEEPTYREALQAGGQPLHSEQGNYIVTQKDSLEAPKTFGETVLPALGWVWLTGVVLMLTYAAVSYFLLKRKMAVATRLQENIWQCEKADMPFVLGVFRPKIYLPYGITGEDLGYVIAHEQAHIVRRDHWWKPLGFILLSVHWFNPVLWVAYILLCRDIEAACDEKVIGPMEKESVRAYSTALLNCSVHRRRIAACPLAFGETGVKERIKRVMNYKKPTFWIILIAVVIAVALIVCFCTDPLKKTENPDPTDPTATEQTENTEGSNQTEGNTNQNSGITNENQNTGGNTSVFEEATAEEMIALHKTVLTGPVTQYVQVDDSRTVIYRLNYEKEDTAIPIFLPKFLPFSADAIACQAGLEKDLESELRSVTEAVNQKDGCMVLYINFEAYLNGDILSVVITSEASYDYRVYYTYNFDVTTGKRLSREDVVKKLQITNFDEQLAQTAKNGFVAKYGSVSDTDAFKTQQLNATIAPANLESAQLYVGEDGKLMTVIYTHAIAGAAGYYERVPFSYKQTENNATEQTENNGNNETNTATGEPQQSAVTLTHKASFVRGEKSELTGAADIGYGELLDYESCQAFFNRGIINNSLSYSKEFFEDHSLLLLSVPRGSGSAIMAVSEIKYKDGAVYCFLEYPTNRDVVMNADMAYWYCLIEVDTVLPEGTRVMFYSENVEYDLDAYQQKQQQFDEQCIK